jgi:hypothetical protein
MKPSLEENGENTVFCQGELLIFSNLKNTLAGILSFAHKKWGLKTSEPYLPSEKGRLESEKSMGMIARRGADVKSE